MAPNSGGQARRPFFAHPSTLHPSQPLKESVWVVCRERHGESGDSTARTVVERRRLSGGGWGKEGEPRNPGTELRKKPGSWTALSELGFPAGVVHPPVSSFSFQTLLQPFFFPFFLFFPGGSVSPLYRDQIPELLPLHGRTLGISPTSPLTSGGWKSLQWYVARGDLSKNKITKGPICVYWGGHKNVNTPEKNVLQRILGSRILTDAVKTFWRDFSQLQLPHTLST